MMKQHEHMTSTAQRPNRQRRPLIIRDTEGELDQFKNSPIDHVVTAINNLPHILKRGPAHIRILNTQVMIFRRSKDKLHELGHLLLKYLEPNQKLITKEHKLHYVQSLLRV